MKNFFQKKSINASGNRTTSKPTEPIGIVMGDDTKEQGVEKETAAGLKCLTKKQSVKEINKEGKKRNEIHIFFRGSNTLNMVVRRTLGF